jgi:hypothetical protein
VLLPPPSGFDPAAIRWVGQIDWSTEEAWTGAIDGSELMKLQRVDDGALIASDGSLVGTERREQDPVERNRLIREVPGGAVTVLVRNATAALDVAEDGPTVYVARQGMDRDGFTVDLGYWRVPLNGSKPRRVLPPSGVARTVGAVSPSGRSVVSSDPIGLAASKPEARFRMGPVRSVPSMFPLGFDEQERLIGLRDRLVRYDPATRRLEVILPDADISARMLPGGRWAQVVFDIEPYRSPALVDLRDLSTWDLGLVEARWRATRFSTDRYAVLEASVGGGLVHAVVDLVERWVGYIPFEPRPMLAVSPGPSPSAISSPPASPAVGRSAAASG